MEKRRTATEFVFSDNIIHKCCKFLNIKSKVKHYKNVYEPYREEHKIYPNLIHTYWDTDH